MLLEVKGLRIAFRVDGKLSVPVRDVSFSVAEGSRTALVGESGCGKSLTALSLGGLVDRAEISGEILGSPRISYVFQNPMQSLNPVMRCGRQIDEAIHARMASAATRRRIAELLAAVALPAATGHRYP